MTTYIQCGELLRKQLLTSHGWFTSAPWSRRSCAIFRLPPSLAPYRPVSVPCRMKTVECHMTSKNDEAIHMLALDACAATLHSLVPRPSHVFRVQCWKTWDGLGTRLTLHAYIILQCCTLLTWAPLFSNNFTTSTWLFLLEKYKAVPPSCKRDK